MANKYQNSSQNKATKNLNQTARQTVDQPYNLEPNQTSSQNTRLASGLQRSISRLARRIKKAKPKLVLSLAFLVALPLIALGVFFGTGLNQEFGASAQGTVVTANDIQTIDYDGKKQVDPVGSGVSHCDIEGDRYHVNEYLQKNNNDQWEKNIQKTVTTDKLNRCAVKELIGHDKGYTNPPLIEKETASAIQLILKQNNQVKAKGNCGYQNAWGGANKLSSCN